MARAQVRLIESHTREDCEAQVNAFLSTVSLGSLMGMDYGYALSDRFKPRYWCIIVFQEN